jgi:hypothetical protein
VIPDPQELQGLPEPRETRVRRVSLDPPALLESQERPVLLGPQVLSDLPAPPGLQGLQEQREQQGRLETKEQRALLDQLEPRELSAPLVLSAPRVLQGLSVPPAPLAPQVLLA